MIFDEHRNSAYAQAIKQFVTAESVVLDLGAGLGIHGMIAALAGARKVYLVDPSPILDVTEQVVRDNGLQDRVKCIQGRIESVRLPEKVDLIVSVFTGNFLLEEDLLPSLFFARDHFLKKGGILLPDRAVMKLAPISAPEYHEQHINSWSQVNNGISFKKARNYAANHAYQTSAEDIRPRILAAPVELLDLNFLTAQKAECRSRVEMKILEPDTCHGFLGWFDARLGKSWLSTSPESQKLHWSQLYLPLDPPMNFERGDCVNLELIRQEYSYWTWRVESGQQSQKRSTFLGGGLSLDGLKKQARNYFPRLNEKGEVARFLLQNLDGGFSVEQLEGMVRQEFGDNSLPTRELQALLKSLVRSFG